MSLVIWVNTGKRVVFKMAKIKSIGVIVEDQSDFDSIRILVSRIIGKDNVAFRPAIAHGCGRLQKKAYDFSCNLYQKGCNLLILVHDLDRNNLHNLQQTLQRKLKGVPFSSYFICIPIEEIEAWFLSDPAGIRRTLRLKKTPNVKNAPESIKDPKERLGKYIEQCSGKERLYVNTVHNAQLSKVVSIQEAVRKCPSFKKLHDFVGTHSY